MNLSGLPFTLGFYIKHILLAYLSKDSYIYYIMLGFVLGGAISGLIYSYRLYYYVFFDLKKGKKYIYSHTNRQDLKSLLYSNTTLASNCAISGLIIIGYCISTYVYIVIFSKFSISESLDIVSVIPSSYLNLN
jgi:NADH:ubiquinone oxidoreductase subunit 5 (subunit L)/multisubunit Na+/H+ antiporter MnhA subunit